MTLLKLNLHHYYHRPFGHGNHHLNLCPPSHFLFFHSLPNEINLSKSFSTPRKASPRLYAANPISFCIDKNEEKEIEEYLAEDGEVYQNTLRLVECAMFAAVSGLAFLLSTSLAIESGMKWDQNEDEDLMRLVVELNSQWESIGKALKCRDHECVRRYNSLVGAINRGLRVFPFSSSSSSSSSEGGAGVYLAPWKKRKI